MDSGNLVLVAYMEDDVTAYPLPPGAALTIGRGEDVDVPVKDSSVSRRHCVIRYGARLELEDLGGANGTFVGDSGAMPTGGVTHGLKFVSKKKVELAVGHRVSIGTTVLVVRRVGNDDGSAGASVVRDRRMVDLYEQAARVAQANISVLILGETGVGKEVLARAIHDRSTRAKGQFLGLNCAALSPTLLESELFGHEKGSFTGATQTQPGLFEVAAGGTVFLDEVGELPAAIQVKLLRVLEERKVMRVGGRQARDIDVRFVSATNRDLEKEIAKGTFREDLYFRIHGISFVIPPLRERVSEIEPLARQFASGLSRQLDRPMVPEFSPEVLTLLQQHAWPGNIRELKNVVERAVVLCPGPVMLREHLPSKLLAPHTRLPVAAPSNAGAPPPAPISPRARDSADAIALERQRIVAALEECGGNQTRAAEILGISRRTLTSWLERHQLPRPRKPQG